MRFIYNRYFPPLRVCFLHFFVKKLRNLEINLCIPKFFLLIATFGLKYMKIKFGKQVVTKDFHLQYSHKYLNYKILVEILVFSYMSILFENFLNRKLIFYLH